MLNFAGEASKFKLKCFGEEQPLRAIKTPGLYVIQNSGSMVPPRYKVVCKAHEDYSYLQFYLPQNSATDISTERYLGDLDPVIFAWNSISLVRCHCSAEGTIEPAAGVQKGAGETELFLEATPKLHRNGDIFQSIHNLGSDLKKGFVKPEQGK